MRIIASVLLLVLSLNGCFAYQAPRAEPLRQGQGVRVLLAQPQDVRLTQVTANNVVNVEGEVVRADSAQLALSARMLRSSSGYEQLGENATVVIPRLNIQQLQERRLSRARTAGLIGLVVALTVGVAAANTGTGVRGGEGGGPPTGQ